MTLFDQFLILAHNARMMKTNDRNSLEMLNFIFVFFNAWVVSLNWTFFVWHRKAFADTTKKHF